ncbi:MAG TPA: S41 family peptidase [Actinomycetota bacterium]|jgi:carboxyl-terminal processing protease|nr:S41 family peptidase [Actinomycetota bacterium]
MLVRYKIFLAFVAALCFGAGVFSLGYSMAASGRSIVLGDFRDGDGSALLSEAIDEIRSTAVDPPSERALVRGALKGMIDVVKKSGDPYALFYTPKAYNSFQDLTRGSFSGIGVWLKEKDDLEIVSVLPDTPAVEAGLERGDVITSIDGRPVEGMTSDEAVARIKGKEGTQVTLGIRRGSEDLRFTITRAQIELPNLKAGTVGEDVGYIRLFGFGRGAGEQLRNEVKRLLDGGATGIVLDLRDNGGGLFTEGIEVASAFIEDGTIVIYRERGSEDIAYEAEGNAFQDVPLVVLVNEGTASASEIVAGALQETDRAVVVGTRTYGKGSVQEVVPLFDSSAVKLTTAAYLTPGGRNINGRGIEPDVEVDDPAAQKARAVEILRGIMISTTGSEG